VSATTEPARTYDPDVGAAIQKRATALIPLLRRQSDAIDRTGRLPPEVVAAMDEAGVYKLGCPPEFGGYSDLPVRDIFQIIREISKGNGSAGWSVAINVVAAAVLTAFDPQAVVDVFTTKHVGPLSAGSVFNVSHATGFGRKVDGGFMVRGAWSFSSNVRLAAWEVGGFSWTDDHGSPRREFMLLPRKNFKIADDWNVVGLKGTCSNSAYAPDEVFVPDHHTCPAADLAERVISSQKMRVPPALSNAAIALGMTEGAFEIFLEKVAKRAPWGMTYPTIADMPSTHVLVAKTRATIELCEAALMNAADRMDTALPANLDQLRAQADFQGTSAIHMLRPVVDNLVITIGSSCAAESDALGRFGRDLFVLSLHGLHRLEWQAEGFGRVMLGKQDPHFGLSDGNMASEPLRTDPPKLRILED
jgi:alkylation response protein AidB-like acyl-CoA dehydrogenase